MASRPDSRTVGALETAQSLVLAKIVSIADLVLSDPQISEINTELTKYTDQVRTLESKRLAELCHETE